VHVVYGQPALKTTPSACSWWRREGDGVRNYVHIGTGNYHSATPACTRTSACSRPTRQIGADVADIVQTPHRLRPPAALSQGADGAQPSARRHHQPDEQTIAAHSNGFTGIDLDEDELASSTDAASAPCTQPRRRA